jgi:hypothetical protein
MKGFASPSGAAKPTNRPGAKPSLSCAAPGPFCPGRLLRDWLDGAGLTEGALFRQVAKGGKRVGARLGGRAYYVVINQGVAAIGLDASKFGSHSMRSGWISTAANMLAAILLFVVQAAFAQECSIIVASTTSTEQSGLFGFLLPHFSAKAGIQVKVVAVGAGQAPDIGGRGDANVVFVHDKPAEENILG